MKIRNSKLKGFTIIELIVTLIISSIIITSVYYSLSQVSEYYNKYTNLKSQITDLEIMNSNIKYNFFNCNEILIDNNELLFINKANTVYEITDTSILNIKNNTYIYANEISTEALWNNKIVEYGNIDELFINITLLKDTISIHYLKDYALDKVIEINNLKSNEYGY